MSLQLFYTILLLAWRSEIEPFQLYVAAAKKSTNNKTDFSLRSLRIDLDFFSYNIYKPHDGFRLIKSIGC